MSIIRCPNCKRKISSKSLKCAYCGCPIPEDPYQKMLKFLCKSVFYTSFIAVILICFLTTHISTIVIMFMVLFVMALTYKNIINKR